jgi:predicted RNA-binding protein YlxR (DUF448 family)
MCALTRSRRRREELLRFVAGPDGTVVPDLKGVLPGRGVWLSLSRQAVDEAVNRKVFSRALKSTVAASAELPDQVETLLRRDCISALSLANKAGQAVTGFDKVSALVERGGAALLIGAADGAADGRRKLFNRALAANPEVQCVDCLRSADLDLAFGRTNVIHAAVKPGGLAKKFLACARRYEMYELNGSREGREVDTQ